MTVAGRKVRRRLAIGLLAIAVAALAACSDSKPAAQNGGDGGGGVPAFTDSGSYGPIDAGTAADPPAAPKNPDGGTKDLPDSIDHDCKSDVTDALNSAFDGIPDNSTVRFAENGCYRLDGTLMLDKRNRLTLDGRGATLKAGVTGGRDQRHVTVSSSSDITITQLTVIGSNAHGGATAGAYDPSLAFQHAFNLVGDQRVLLDNVRAAQLHGDFVYIGGVKSTASTDVTVINSQFENSGRQGISVTNGDRVLIADNHLTGVARSMFDIELNKDADAARNVRITNNHTGAAVNFWLANKGASNNIGPIEIDHNVMEETTGGLFFAFGQPGGTRGPWVVRDNQLIANNAVTDEGSVGAFLFSNCSKVALADNKVTFPAGTSMPAVELRASNDIQVTGNDFTGASQPIQADSATTGVTFK